MFGEPRCYFLQVPNCIVSVSLEDVSNELVGLEADELSVGTFFFVERSS